MIVIPTFEKEKENEFNDFIRNFRINNEFYYRNQILNNKKLNKNYIEIDILHLYEFNSKLASNVNILYEEFENVLKEYEITQLMIISRSNPIPIRQLDSLLISKMVRVSGIVISVNSIQSKIQELQLYCKSCFTVKHVNVKLGLHGIHIPQCENEKCPRDSFIVSHSKSKFIDQQLIKIQEPHGMVPVGELPRHLLVCVDRYLTDKVMPGMRVTLTGIFDIFNQSSNTIRTPYLYVLGIQLDPDSNTSVKYSPAEEEEFIRISRRPNLYNEFISSIAPQIYGSEDIKKSIACLLFSGSKKYLPDGMTLRGDINVMMLGDPGTAKSQLLKFVEKVAPVAVYTSGKGSSAAGLTASVTKDPSTREFKLEAGAMVLADGGVVCIDEFDKMRDEDRVAIHEAMEQQTISIAKAGITTILNSRCSVLAAANPVFGRYDVMKSPIENIEFQSTILSRFDLIFIIKDEYHQTRDSLIAKHVIGVHMHIDKSIEGDLDIQKMRSYIAYCRSKCAPRLSAEASDRLSAHFVELRSKIRSLENNAIPITVRQLEAIIRIAESLAKMTLSPVATVAHVDEAIRLFNVATVDAIQTQVVGGDFAGKVNVVEQFILKRFAVGSTMRLARLREELEKNDFKGLEIDRAIYQLVSKDVLTYRDRRARITRTK